LPLLSVFFSPTFLHYVLHFDPPGAGSPPTSFFFHRLLFLRLNPGSCVFPTFNPFPFQTTVPIGPPFIFLGRIDTSMGSDLTRFFFLTSEIRIHVVLKQPPGCPFFIPPHVGVTPFAPCVFLLGRRFFHLAFFFSPGHLFFGYIPKVGSPHSTDFNIFDTKTSLFATQRSIPIAVPIPDHPFLEVFFLFVWSFYWPPPLFPRLLVTAYFS